MKTTTSIPDTGRPVRSLLNPQLASGLSPCLCGLRCFSLRSRLLRGAGCCHLWHSELLLPCIYTFRVRKTASSGRLTKNRLSDNVGGVKYFLSVLLCALGRARHFALVEKQLPMPTKARS